ncbi:DUF4345 domain-containing protein [Streptomyces sp. NPDC006446]|uniref:DUF4345 domain-containing protein n=1 Tax=Streptomyces sp. NPDC006446 TaxID=3154301 RepID=UPI0033ABEC2F
MAATSVVAATTVVRVCLLLAAAIALADGLRQLTQGGPTGTAEADNAYRFVSGVYIGWAPLLAWAAATIRRQGPLVYFLTVPILLGGIGRLVSFAQDGMPRPAGGFLASAALELILPIAIVWAHSTALRSRRAPATA